MRYLFGVGKRRHHRGILSIDNVKILAAGCIILFLVGNMVMLQSYHGLTAPSPDELNTDHSREPAVFPHYSKDLDSSRKDQVDILNFQSFNNRELFDRFAAEFLPLDKLSVFGVGENQYSILEARARRLMEDGNDRDRIYKWKRNSENYNNLHKNSLYFKEADSFRDGIKLSLSENLLDNVLLNCEDIDAIQDLEFIGSGWTKSVFRGVYKGENVAIKTVDIEGHDVAHCMQKGENMTQCYGKAARKIIKEIVLLQALANENVIKVLGFCVPTKPYDGNVDSTVAMVTELGEPVDQIKLLQMSWEDRLRVSYDVIKLIAFLAQTRYGSVALNDFRRTQFVLVNGTLKLSDVDDAGFGEPDCLVQEDCSFKPGDANLSKALKCSNGRCADHNELHNIYKTGQQFSTFLLPHGAPRLLRPIIDKIVQHFEHLTATTKSLLKDVERVVTLYKTGAYLEGSKKDRTARYEAHPHSDFPGLYDYRCRFSISGGACTLSVFDLKEAEAYCDMDEECKGFVWTDKHTWTGRTIIHLKNGCGERSSNQETDLYLKPA